MKVAGKIVDVPSSLQCDQLFLCNVSPTCIQLIFVSIFSVPVAQYIPSFVTVNPSA